MIIEMTLDVQSQDLYALIFKSLFEDVHKCNPRIKKSDLVSGLTYNKKIVGKMKQQAVTEAKIESLVEGIEYVGSFASTKGTTTIAYKLESHENHTNISYEETFKANKFLTGLNYKLVSTFYKRKSKKRMITMFKNMEAYLLQNKEN